MTVQFWRVIGHYTGESQTYEALAGAFQASPYAPDIKGRLKAIRVIPAAEAATSLIEGIQFRLSCTSWKPNTIHVAVAGNGLRTVPATPQTPIDYPVDQPVEPSVGITIEGRHAVATAVTCNVILLGLFEAAE